MTDLLPYDDFLQAKVHFDDADGFEIADSDIHPILLEHQRLLVRWGVARGRGAFFAAFGLGKTIIQLETVRLILKCSGKQRGLIVVPLAVRQEMRRDAKLIDLDVTFVRSNADITGPGIYLTNYESVRLGKVDVTQFDVVSLDEAAVLRSLSSKQTQALLTQIRDVRYRYLATATPSPNRYIELVNYADWLGVMDRGQSLTRWFQRDTTHAGNLTLHPHKIDEFHLWLSTWAVFLQKPSDLGCSDERYALPPIDVQWHEVEVDHSEHISADRDGQSRMFRGAELGVSDASREKRMTLDVRVAKMAELVNEAPDDHFILWHHLEDERKAIRKALPEATEVFGALDLNEQERRVIAFADGETRLLATKPSINGAGCNLQRHCHRAIYVGVDFDFHLFIQSVHRIQRFQQSHPVRIDIIYAESEREVIRTLRRKWKEHEELTTNMSDLIKEHGLSREAIDKALTRSIGTERVVADGNGWMAVLNDCVYELRDHMADNSIDMHLTSIPFGNHYEYSASVNDLGHTDDNDHFWQQMDYITPNLLRTLKPGRVYACHVKDRMLYGNMTGAGCQTSSPFHAEAIMHNIKHGFLYLGMITIVTDVVAENNQTYRLTQKEMRKDGTKMGVGSPEYVLLFRKQQTDLSNEYADEPVVHSKANYSLARWQTDAHGFWRSSGDRYLSPDELAELPADQVYGLWRKYSRDNIYDYDVHLQIGEALEGRGSLPSKFMLLAPESNHPDVWTDVDRLHTLNGEQSRRNLQQHICPFGFDTVDRLIERYSNKGDLIFDPFGGLSTVAVRAMILGRRGYTVELNPSSWRDGVNYCAMTERKVSAPTLFDLAELDAAS